MWLIILVFVILIFLIKAKGSRENFAAGLDAVNAECINRCEQRCIEDWPVYLRGPINSGIYLCSRWCEQYCAGCKNPTAGTPADGQCGNVYRCSGFSEVPTTRCNKAITSFNVGLDYGAGENATNADFVDMIYPGSNDPTATTHATGCSDATYRCPNA